MSRQLLEIWFEHSTVCLLKSQKTPQCRQNLLDQIIPGERDWQHHQAAISQACTRGIG